MALQIVIMAAGKGTRMNSRLPKVLHRLAGTCMLTRVIQTAQTLAPQNIFVIYGHEGEQVKAALEHLPVQWIEQTEQLGTGHAVSQAMPQIREVDQVLVLSGDVPLISQTTLQKLISMTPSEGLGLVVAEFPDPTGLGRIVRDATNRIIRIAEEKDATPHERSIREIYSGIMLAEARFLKSRLPMLSKNNAQGEYYLTELIASAARDTEIASVNVEFPEEVQGVNSRKELAKLERFFQKQQVERLMAAGVTIMDPARVDIRGTVTAEPDVVIDVNVIFEGNVFLGRNTVIGPNCVIRDSRLANDVSIFSHCVIEESEIAEHCTVGPFARVRPKTKMHPRSKIGNFVEVKKSDIGPGSKVSHLSYIGDCTIGSEVNVGAGTITCNYDGVHKHQTIIEDGVFIGSGTQLVAPVTIGASGTIAAGSTITDDTPRDALTLARSRQHSVEGWKPKKQK